MKIKLKVKLKQLTAIEYLLSHVEMPPLVEQVKMHKARINILQNLYKKVINKALPERFAPSDKKVLTLSLEYFEAYELEIHLRQSCRLYDTNSYDYNAVCSIADEIDQKLQ